MNPSVIIKDSSVTYLVVYRHSWGCKRDTMGRKIPGTSESTGWLGVTVSRFGEPKTAKDYPPMRAQEALKLFIGS